MQSNGKPCHNCRRRRLRCDRSWPTCHKCAASGQECLGYGKIFTWTQGIDGNGVIQSSQAGRRANASATSSTSTTPNPPQGFVAFQPPTIAPVQQSPKHNGQSPVQTQMHQFLPSRPFPVDNTPPLTPKPTFASRPMAGTSMALTDPLFQDLDRDSRYYLSHFADRVCQDLVARDQPNNNPFRELLPLTKQHPVLLQILIATSALHWSNIFRPVTDIPSELTDPGGYLAQLRSTDLVSRKALIDALTAKQRAMGHLREVLDTLDPAGNEVVLASLHFFIKFDLMDLEESGNGGWRTHLEGASSIMALLSKDSMSASSSRMLRDTVIADCFIYHILGSTISGGSLATRIARYALEILPIMKRVEVITYLSCPPEILQIILLASQLSYNESVPATTDWNLPAAGEALSLIDQLLEFDINAWAAALEALPNVTDIESRVHIASAHRSAACLYIIQALPLVRSVRSVDANFLVEDILSHLAEMPEDDPYFKATSWPLLFAGAETRDPEKRTWILKRLMSIWSRFRWGYIFTAIEMLKATWHLQDASPQSENVNWLRDLKGLGFNMLVV
ncbi:Acriflavine sensitivity control protein-like protein [Emericellopsis cladophorae]|uniref:Acriflavine sensitivity control protein-like protein n=1 Tax=Emericellopsis cladophorae TaxID=2686198 RepID=A0A9Q0B9J3_9HYPO|nr:Acriflavine sensitivity control protein-like protein [Emericellopsis cladophorae]KAI6778487.1 Acriflavine sensitivity control protein-like protein [Emericellopsis cladophorae]